MTEPTEVLAPVDLLKRIHDYLDDETLRLPLEALIQKPPAPRLRVVDLDDANGAYRENTIGAYLDSIEAVTVGVLRTGFRAGFDAGRASVLSGLTVERIAEVAEEAHRQLARDGLHAEYGPGSLHEAIGIAVLALINKEITS